MDQPKLFSGFLSGVSKRIFDRDNDITIEFLKEQLFPSYNDITLEGSLFIHLIISEIIYRPY